MEEGRVIEKGGKGGEREGKGGLISLSLLCLFRYFFLLHGGDVKCRAMNGGATDPLSAPYGKYILATS